jgi:hypothetical protein
MTSGNRTDTGPGGGEWTGRAVLLVVALIAVLQLQACASSAQIPPQHDRTRISLEEIDELAERTPASQIVRRLRPAWLRGRGQTRLRGAEPSVVVYVNNQRVGGAEALERFTSWEIRELNYLDAVAATQRFGTGHGAGAILIVLR